MYRLGDWAFVGILLVLGGDRLRARGRADRDGPARLQRVLARRLGGGSGLRGDRHERGRPARRAAHDLVVARAAGARFRGGDPLHEGLAHAGELRLAGRARSAGRQAAASDPARARGGAGGLRRARRLQRRAPAPARRLHEVREVPRGLPGAGHRAAAVAARRGARAARAGKRGDARGGDRRRARRTDQGPAARKRRVRAPVVREDGVRAETVWSCMQCNACVEACPVGIEQAPIINQMRRRLVEEGEMPANCRRRSRRSTSRATRSASGPASAAAGPRSSTSRSRTRARSRWTCCGSSATTRPSTRAARRSRARSRASCTPPARLRDPLRRRAQLRQRRAPRRRGGAVRGARRAEHRDARGVRLRADRHHRPALAQHAAQRVPGADLRRARRLTGASPTTPPCCSS